jgi:4-amino-4-deoxy-L-arabinose transferase-like glycosyltransferase
MENLVLKPLLLFVIIILVYCLAIPVDIMEIDSAQYATIAQEMILRNDYLHVYDRGTEYLDKPPFIFWITAAFYHLFGMGTFAFKLPSILFSCLGIFATYKFARIYYSKETAVMSALILATTQGYFHFNNDVRTDTYLTNSIITAVWLICEYLRNSKWLYLLAGFAMIGIAMLSKGPLGIIIPAIAIGGDLLIRKEWKLIFKWEWLLGILVVFIVLSPMLIGLYEQFDLHPEKIVNEKTGVSGLRFFFWEQSFGRITGENVWKNDTGPFFFFPNIAWSFMPWTVPLFLGVIHEFICLIKQKSYYKNKIEWISLLGLIIPFIALSQSQYKLPHYIYVVFPFAAIIAADYLNKLQLVNLSDRLKIINVLQTIILSIVWILAGLIFCWFFPLQNWALILVGAVGLISFIYFIITQTKNNLRYFIVISLITVLSSNILIACQFYPSLLKYQAGGQVAKEILAKEINPNNVFIYRLSARSVDVKTHSVILEPSLPFIKEKVEILYSIHVVTDYQGVLDLKSNGYNVEVISKKPNHAVSLITFNFLNPNTRDKTLEFYYLASVNLFNHH